MVFIKKQENFICENCGKKVIGDGYTNHCPKCLWSKHMDIDPGDRASNCKSMMKPISVNVAGGKFSITHQCVKCGHKKNNIISNQDNIDAIIDL